MPNKTARILFLDIENAPSLGWAWSKYDTTVLDFQTDWYLLSFAWRWIDEASIHVLGLPDFPASYRRDREDDRALTKELWKLLDAADLVVGHNVERFDLRKINTRFLTHGLPPPSPYRTLDTLKVAKRYFRFDSNRLDDLGRCLGVGRKLQHTGFELWRNCMAGQKAAWKTMLAYNRQDVALLVKVYYLLRAWAGTHPNVNRGTPGCPKCGSPNVQKRGFEYTLLRRKQRYQCRSCYGWYSGPAVKEAE